MSFEIEAKSLESHFNTQWASTTPIAFENVEFVPTAGQAWVELRVVPNDSYQASLGDLGHYRHYGIISINVYVPKGIGTRQARGYADQAAAVFRSQTVSGIVCRTPKINIVGQIKEWFAINVSVPFYRNEYP